MQRANRTWKDAVADALETLGGQGHLSQINEQIERNAANQAMFATNPTWRDTVRRVVRQYKIFEPVPPERSGIYRLAEAETPLPSAESLSLEKPELSHGDVQGMLVVLGRIYNYATFVPKTDQTTREFGHQRLRDLVSVVDCAEIFDSENIARIKEIDVLWFDEDDDGLFPVYAFEVEHTTMIKDGMLRLLTIPKRLGTRLFVLGDSEEQERRFDGFVRRTPFRDYQARFAFRFYRQLRAVYDAAISHETHRTEFGLSERYRKAEA